MEAMLKKLPIPPADLSSASPRISPTASSMNFYPAPPVIQAEVYVQIPASLRCSGQPTEWRGGSASPPSDIFLEGPTWTSGGDLYVTDIPYGRIIKIDTLKQATECVRYDGEPNGLALRDDGCILVADYKQVSASGDFLINSTVSHMV